MAEGTSLYDRLNALLEAYAPRDLYRRALTIMITPVVLLNILFAVVLVSRYLDNVANVLSRTLAYETALIVKLYEDSDKSPAAIARVKDYAEQSLNMQFKAEPGTTLPTAKPEPVLAVIDRKINAFLAEDLDKPFVVDARDSSGRVAVHVQVAPDMTFVISVDENRAQAVGTPLLLLFMALSTLVFMAIAVVFMRNQIKPILDLTAAAQAFGKGRDTASFKPEGASEVRLAGEAFLDMQRRIARHVEQRTTLLAGVSHDLRTILTRFKLQLAVFGKGPKTVALHEDVNEMQHMLEDYMAFVRGDGGEQAASFRVPELVQSVVAAIARGGAVVEVKTLPDLMIMVKPNAFRRLLGNVTSNAQRFAKHVQISGEAFDDRLWLYVDDDGPGIPPHLREEAFKPFTRLDEARNLDHSGSGLGLAIALDIAQAHGGDIALGDSPIGGLRVTIRVPF
ncbi:ATP-binding protein [Aestuariivirga litoralis]|uniref:ATP-binding protein n=1 Tax=Aestuariivirga litoralis TaxID=2650924 RepID=UPI0018C7A846|nr:ATP-binding protein [Aestuariivirga litoralis]MBG1230968.1 HAMP domain-containing protein [Aestuariivirga litoralis]